MTTPAAHAATGPRDDQRARSAPSRTGSATSRGSRGLSRAEHGHACPAPYPPSCRPREVGQWGEAIAARYLLDKGWRIEERNWRPAPGSELRGELDLIARDPAGSVVAIEVKARRSCRAGTPAAAVSARKLATIRRLLAAWLEQREEPPTTIRVDVISVTARRGQPCLLQHHSGVWLS